MVLLTGLTHGGGVNEGHHIVGELQQELVVGLRVLGFEGMEEVVSGQIGPIYPGLGKCESRKKAQILGLQLMSSLLSKGHPAAACNP